ncbi:hypothetical protein K7W42_18645 [Deinococcus sp. HMF7604]|uniref:hypothetical protein n=1 Tax=Deinococcus betulae TaxID=2873312 RepID=UPI001CCF646F|nr:hypothetical protein [Deinococcus betulae]MBZ9752863.1 hypothetical protein [Deinococcus betulae]
MQRTVVSWMFQSCEGAVFLQEFEGEEELFTRAEGRGSTGLFLEAFSLAQDDFHLGEGFGVDTGVPLEARAIQRSDAFQTVVTHSYSVTGTFAGGPFSCQNRSKKIRARTFTRRILIIRKKKA